MGFGMRHKSRQIPNPQSRITFLCAALLLIAAPLAAQTRNRPRAEVTPIVLSGTRLALRVTLPEGLHTQSNKPRDPSLIPTELTIDAPSGTTVDEIVWPEPQDLKQQGQDQPLAVFEREFYVGVQLKSGAPLAPGTRIPAHLRYQACDANLCYAPTTADVEWTIGPADAESAQVSARIKFGSGDRVPLNPKANREPGTGNREPWNLKPGPDSRTKSRQSQTTKPHSQTCGWH